MATVVDDCVVFAGQSNGQTFGNDGSVPATAFPGGWTADPNILIWAGVPPVAWAQYDPASNADPAVGGNYWGPEAEFARQWRLDSPRKLRIIKRCIGATGLVNPPAGPNWSAYTGGVFSDLITDIGAAGGALPIDTHISIKAFVWMGNESDTTVDQATADLVQRELQMWFEAARSVTNSPMARGITSVILDASPNGTYTPTVRRAQRYAGLLPRNGYADQAALAFDGTTHHLTRASVVQHGADLYRAYKAADTRVIP